MSAPTQQCPTCQGNRLHGDPTGFRWAHVGNCALRAADDSTVEADFRRPRWQGSVIRRPVTAAELTLLGACGVTLPDDALTTVTMVTGSIRGRSWAGVTLD